MVGGLVHQCLRLSSAPAVRSHVHGRSQDICTWVQCRVHNLLRLPYVWCHLLDLPRLVRHDGILRSLESLLAHKERPIWEKLQQISDQCYSGKDNWITSEQRMAAYCYSTAETIFSILHSPWTVLSPRIGNTSSLPDATPVCAEVILRLRQLAIARKGGRHVCDGPSGVVGEGRGEDSGPGVTEGVDVCAPPLVLLPHSVTQALQKASAGLISTTGGYSRRLQTGVCCIYVLRMR